MRRKFSALCRAVPPTGDPSITQDVLKAEEIRKKMTERADLGDGEESDDPFTNELHGTLPFSASHSGSLSAPSGAGTPGLSPSPLQDDAASNDISRRDSGMELMSPRLLVRSVGRSKLATDEDSPMSTVMACMVQDQKNRDAEYTQPLIDRS